MKATKLKSGNYRIQFYIDGSRKSYTFDHNPTQKEIKQYVFEQQSQYHEQKSTNPGTFSDYADKYLDIKCNILSPSTKRSYYAIKNKIADWFNNKPIDDITQVDCQRLINELAAKVAPKTVRNYYGFISAVISTYCPNKVFKISFPAKKKQDDYIPTAEEVKAVLDAAKGSKWFIIFSLGCYGLRRSEILPLTLDDIGPDYVDINKTMVLSETNTWITKEIGKTETSLRRVPISKNLSKLIHDQGFICNFHPDKILHHLHQYQKKAKVQQFRFHLLRHFFCTELSQNGFSEEDIMAIGGWSTPHVMKKVYRHNRILQDNKEQNKLSKTISSIIE